MAEEMMIILAVIEEEGAHIMIADMVVAIIAEDLRVMETVGIAIVDRMVEEEDMAMIVDDAAMIDMMLDNRMMRTMILKINSNNNRKEEEGEAEVIMHLRFRIPDGYGLKRWIRIRDLDYEDFVHTKGLFILERCDVA